MGTNERNRKKMVISNQRDLSSSLPGDMEGFPQLLQQLELIGLWVEGDK